MDDKVLSRELIVAAEIYRLTDIAHEEVYYSRLVGNLKGRDKVSSSATIAKALEVLLDLGIVDAEWKRLENGHWARGLKVAGESRSFIRSVHEKFYSDK